MQYWLGYITVYLDNTCKTVYNMTYILQEQTLGFDQAQQRTPEQEIMWVNTNSRYPNVQHWYNNNQSIHKDLSLCVHSFIEN